MLSDSLDIIDPFVLAAFSSAKCRNGAPGDKFQYDTTCPICERDGKLAVGFDADDGRWFCHCIACNATNKMVGAALKLSNADFNMPLRISDLANYVRLPEAWLVEKFGLENIELPYPGVAIPFRYATGDLHRRQYRLRIHDRADGDKKRQPRFRWEAGKSGALPYNLDGLGDATSAIFVEGASDVWTLAFNGYATLGAPGQGVTKGVKREAVANLADILVFREPDATFPENVARTLGAIGWTGTLRVIDAAAVGAKDPSELWKRLRDSSATDDEAQTAFRSRVDSAIAKAEPLALSNDSDARNAPAYAENYDPAGRPEIDASDQDLFRLRNRTIELLETTNASEPHLFKSEGKMLRLEPNDKGRIQLVRLDADRLTNVVTESLCWFAAKGGAHVISHAAPSPALIASLLASKPSELPFPILSTINDVPIFRPDGTLVDTPGYDAATESWYEPTPGLEVHVPETPTQADIERAKALIFDDLLVDFPFDAGEDNDDARRNRNKAHALALLLTPFVRSAILGPTPLMVIDAPDKGNGKGLLARCLLNVSCGGQFGSEQFTARDEEMDKRILASLVEGTRAVLFDNVEGLVRSAPLASALTEDVYKGRILGKTQSASAPIRCVWALTANNAMLHEDIARRTIPIRINANMEYAFTRTEFKHPDVIAWAAKHRGELISAALTLIRAWFVEGCPKGPQRPLGSYASWTHVIGGILHTAGVPGFLTYMEEVWASAAGATDVWTPLIQAWAARYKASPVPAKALIGFAEDAGFVYKAEQSPASRAMSLGRRLMQKKDVVLAGGFRIRDAGHDSATHGQLWKLEIPAQQHANVRADVKDAF